MPQVDFFLSEKERADVIKFAFNQKLKIIPDCEYDDNKHMTITDIDGYSIFCRNVPRLYLTTKHYDVHPVQLQYFKGQPRTSVLVRERYGGPCIDFFSPVVEEFEENIVGPGLLGIYPYYYSNNTPFVPNIHFQAIYVRLAMFIKKMSKRVDLGGKAHWIGTYAAEQVKQNNLQFLAVDNIQVLTQYDKAVQGLH